MPVHLVGKHAAPFSTAPNQVRQDLTASASRMLFVPGVTGGSSVRPVTSCSSQDARPAMVNRSSLVTYPCP